MKYLSKKGDELVMTKANSIHVVRRFTKGYYNDNYDDILTKNQPIDVREYHHSTSETDAIIWDDYHCDIPFDVEAYVIRYRCDQTERTGKIIHYVGGQPVVVYKFVSKVPAAGMSISEIKKISEYEELKEFYEMVHKIKKDDFSSVL